MAEKAVVELMNHILSRLHMQSKIYCTNDITTDMFIRVYEQLVGEELPGLIQPAVSGLDNAANLKVLLRTLECEVLKVELDHISPDSVVCGDPIAIANLVEIFSGLLDYLTDAMTNDQNDYVQRAEEEYEEILIRRPASAPSSDQSGAPVDSTNSEPPPRPEIDLSTIPSASSSRTNLHTGSMDSLAEVKYPNLVESLGKEKVARVMKDFERIRGTLSQSFLSDKNYRGSAFTAVTRQDGRTGPAGSSSSPPRSSLRSQSISPQRRTRTPSPRRLVRSPSPELADETVTLDYRERSPHSEGSSRRVRPAEITLSDESEILAGQRDGGDFFIPSQPAAFAAQPSQRRKLAPLRASVDLFQSSSSQRRGPLLSSAPVLQTSRRAAQRRAKAVRFDVSESMAGASGSQRAALSDLDSKLRQENAQQQKAANRLEVRYNQMLSMVATKNVSEMERLRQRSAANNEAFWNRVGGMQKQNKVTQARKSVRRAKGYLTGQIRRVPSRPVPECRDTSTSAASMLEEGKENLLSRLLKEFPDVNLSSESLAQLWRKHIKHVEQMSQAFTQTRGAKTKAQQDVEDANERYSLMAALLRKELSHTQRMKEDAQRRAVDRAAKTTSRNRKMQSIRARNYYSEFEQQLRAKMMRKRSQEEVVFKRLFKQGLDVQKQRLRELRNYASEVREKTAVEQQNRTKSLETYYHDQLGLVAESLATERREIAVRDKEQAAVLRRMQRELRSKLETEVRGLQTQLIHDLDDQHFRELDVDRLEMELYAERLAVKYPTVK